MHDIRTDLAAPFDFGGKAGFENFGWEEFDDDGSKLLKESGTRYALSGFLGNTLRAKKNLIYRAEAKLYFGTVDYEGQTQDGVPAFSDTHYGFCSLPFFMHYDLRIYKLPFVACFQDYVIANGPDHGDSFIHKIRD